MMMSNQAGQSAHERARREREKAERLHRSAAAWEAGAVGEQATSQVLVRLDPAVWTTWHDVRWPGRQRANIDHVVVGPPGVFVIDSKNWSGNVTLTDDVLRQNGRSRESAVVGVAEAGVAVLEIVPAVSVHPVLCLVREESFTGWVGDVMLCSTANLDVMVQTRPHVLSAEQVQATAARLEAGLSQQRRVIHRPAARPRSATRRSGGGSGLKSLAPLLIAGLFAGALFTGAATPTFSWIGDRVSEVIVGEPAPPPTETPKPDRKKKDGPAKKKQQGKKQQ